MVKTQDNFDPKAAIEPGVTVTDDDDDENDKDDSNGGPAGAEGESSTDSSTTTAQKRKRYVPLLDAPKKQKKGKNNSDLLAKASETLDSIRDVLRNDPTKELIELLRKESEDQARRDSQLFQLMMMQVGGADWNAPGASGMMSLNPPPTNFVEIRQLQISRTITIVPTWYQTFYLMMKILATRA